MKFTFMCRQKPVNPQVEGRVAIIGAGPAGLVGAGYLACAGLEVEVYDKLPMPGGMMTFAIPIYRISRESIMEGVNMLKEGFGVKFHLSRKVFCRNESEVRHDEGDAFVKEVIDLKDLLKKYDAILISTGTWRSRRLGIEGEEAKGVVSALDYLFEIWAHEYGFTKHPPPKPKKVIVIGGGLSAIDVAEESIRRGIDEVYLVYRRTIKQAPAGEYEVNRLRRMGVKWIELASPKRIISEKGVVKAVEFIKMRLGEPDASGRPRPIPIEGSEFVIEADMLIAAIGELPTPPLESECAGIKTDRRGRILIDEKYQTGNERVFAAGDVVTGPSKIGSAVGQGLRAARSLHLYLSSIRRS